MGRGLITIGQRGPAAKKEDVKAIGSAFQGSAGPDTEAPSISGNTIKMIGFKEMLEHTESGGLFRHTDSEKYTNLLSVLNKIVRHLTTDRFTTDKRHNLENMSSMKNFYIQLLEATRSYCERNPISSTGKIRQGIALLIQEQANTDLQWINTNIDMVGNTDSSDTWSKLLTDARVRKIKVDSMAGLDTVGGAASINYKINHVERGEQKLGFFKKEEKFIQKGDTDTLGLNGSEYFAEAKEFIIEKYKLRDPGNEDLLQRFNRINSDFMYVESKGVVKQVFKQRPDYVTDANASKFIIDPVFGGIVNALRDRASSYATTDEVFNSMGYMPKQDGDTVEGKTKRGEEINITNRNVAMSKVAALLGVGSLVAKSEIVDIVDAKGTSHRGNLMERAQGKDQDGLLADAKSNPTSAPLARKVAPDQIESVLGNAVSGSLMKELTSLQVVDIICGQVDRHMNNVMFQPDESGKLAHITGIDNDASFGFNEDVASLGSQRKDKRVYKLSQEQADGEKTSELMLPRMDKKLAETILTLSPSMLEYSLVNLLKKAEIKACIKRLNYMKEAILKAKKAKPETFIASDDGWNQEAHSALMEQSAVNKKMRDELKPFREKYEKAKKVLNIISRTKLSPKKAQEDVDKAKKAYQDKLSEMSSLQKEITTDTSYYAIFMQNFLDELEEPSK